MCDISASSVSVVINSSLLIGFLCTARIGAVHYDAASEQVSKSLTSYLTHNRQHLRQVFPANHLAMVLTKQTYNTQDKHKNPKQQNPTNPGLVASLTTFGQETDHVYSNKKTTTPGTSTRLSSERQIHRQRESKTFSALFFLKTSI